VAASVLQASGLPSDVTVFRLNARPRPKTGSRSAFRRNEADRVYMIEAAQTRRSQINLPRYSQRPSNGSFRLQVGHLGRCRRFCKHHTHALRGASRIHPPQRNGRGGNGAARGAAIINVCTSPACWSARRGGGLRRLPCGARTPDQILMRDPLHTDCDPLQPTGLQLRCQTWRNLPNPHIVPRPAPGRT
jgi:hypothetical protein